MRVEFSDIAEAKIVACWHSVLFVGVATPPLQSSNTGLKMKNKMCEIFIHPCNIWEFYSRALEIGRLRRTRKPTRAWLKAPGDHLQPVTHFSVEVFCNNWTGKIHYPNSITISEEAARERERVAKWLTGLESLLSPLSSCDEWSRRFTMCAEEQWE